MFHNPALRQFPTGVANPRKMKPGPINAAANSLTRYPA
jgi:hypothetical protein